MMRVVSVIMAAVLIAFSSLVLGQEKRATQQLKLKDIDGRAFLLSDYKGKVVLLNFWATWCAPCRAEIPDLVKWQREYRKSGLQVIGVTCPPEELAEVRKFSKSMKINYPIALGEKQTKAIYDKGETVPITVVIDKNGVVHKIIKGIIFPEEFERTIKPLFR